MSLTSEERILIVDDDPIIIKLLKSLLLKQYPKVFSASSANEALKILSQAETHCIITDAVMPEMNGYDLTLAIRNHPQWKHIPILMLTRKRHPEDIQKAIKAGVNDYLLKPIDEQLLLDKVSLCLKRNRKKSEVFELELLSSIHVSSQSIVRKISESGITLGLNFLPKSNSRLNLNGDLFRDIGIEPPFIKLIDVEENLVDPEYPILAQFTFIGLVESDLMKLRSWLQRESIRRKK